jgi:P pilus assembly chaperone PapD
MRTLVVLLFAVVVTAVTAARPAYAQVSVEVSPLRVELQTSSGGNTTQPITITNYGKESIRVRAAVTDWDLSRDGTPQFEGVDPGGRHSASEWVRLAPPEQVIEAGRSATVRFSLAVPADVVPAGYRTSLLFQFDPVSADLPGRTREVMFKSRVATLIYVNIGAPPMKAELTDLEIRTNDSNVQIVAVLKNLGRRSVRTKGTLVLHDESGALIREMAVPDVPLLPESEREVAIPLVGGEGGGAALSPGTYRVEVRLDLGLPALLVGETVLKVER